MDRQLQIASTMYHSRRVKARIKLTLTNHLGDGTDDPRFKSKIAPRSDSMITPSSLGDGQVSKINLDPKLDLPGAGHGARNSTGAAIRDAR